MSRTCITSATRTVVTVKISFKQSYIIRLHIVDELDNPLVNLPYVFKNEAGQVFSGATDCNGFIEIKTEYYAEGQLTFAADALLYEMEQRRLRLDRKKSKVAQRAKIEGKEYFYQVVGELCDTEPELDVDWDREKLPSFHFPNGRVFTGLKLGFAQFNRTTLVEVCPFRAWNFVLEHDPRYSVVNAYNLGILANIAYHSGETAEPMTRTGMDSKDLRLKRESSSRYFFEEACLDLSCLPRMHKEDYSSDPVVKDVPFSQRYKEYTYLSTSNEKATTVEALGNMILGGHSTQLFYIANDTELVIAWRGTETSELLIDLLKTDTMFTHRKLELCDVEETESERSVATASCKVDPSLPGKTRGHNGFLQAFNLAIQDFSEEFEKFKGMFRGRKVFIAGHSLGGALALLYAITQRHNNIVLYTYGMPRTITRAAASALDDLCHYRHLNENDGISSVPPEMNADFGVAEYLGPFKWLFYQKLVLSNTATAAARLLGANPQKIYWHHGKIIHFTTLYSKKSSRKGGEASPKSVKLYLVPHLDTECADEMFEAQCTLVSTLKEQGLPMEQIDRDYSHNRHSNPKKGFSLSNHGMNEYVCYMCLRLLEYAERKERHNLEFGALEDTKQHVRQAMLRESDYTEGLAQRNTAFLMMDDQLSRAISSQGDVEALDAIKRFYIATAQDNKLINELKYVMGEQLSG